MNKIIEEALTNMIRRIEDLEEYNKRYYSPQLPPKQFRQTPGKATDNATEGQLKYIKILKGNVKEGMTKGEAGKEIDRLLKEKELAKEDKSDEEIYREAESKQKVTYDDLKVDSRHTKATCKIEEMDGEGLL